LNFIGLVITLAVLYLFIRFSLMMLGHLFRIFGWISSDLTRAVTKVADVDRFAPVEKPPEPGEDIEESGLPEVPRRQASAASDEGLTLSQALFLAFFYLLTITVDALVGLLDFCRRVPAALRMPFPLRCTVWYAGLFLVAIPLVIFMRAPDVYGFKPTISAAYWGTAAYAVFIFLVYFLRALVGLDLETVFQGPAEAEGDEPALLRYRHILYGLVVLAVTAFIVVRLMILGLFALGFFFSLLYFLAFYKRGDQRFTLRSFLVSWLVFLLFAAAAVVLIMYGSPAETIAGFAVPIVVLFALMFIYSLWLMGRKYEVSKGFRELPIRRTGAWINQFVMPFVKLAVAAVLFYFPLLFFSVNTRTFIAGAAMTAVITAARHLLGKRIPRYLPGGLFAGYIFLVWLSIFYVQSYNRIPPSPGECSTIQQAEGIRPVWTMADFMKHDFLEGTLPYDTIYDADSNALFITFKNLSGYGAVVRVDPDTGELEDYIITENDTFTGEMLYPERMCADREEKLLYSTTKSSRNFQLLVMDYSSGLDLAGRIYYPRYETTNCRVDPETGEIYTIFLGPPDSHIRILAPRGAEETGSIHFGRFGYADYFVLDRDNDRLVVPSLDPFNRFSIYVVTGLKEKDYRKIEKNVRARFRFLGAFTVKPPVPTLGIARDGRTGMFYFTLPFLRLVIETDGTDFNLRRQFTAGQFPRELTVDQQRGLLYIANYGDGTIHVLDLERWKLLKEFHAGKLVRSITHDTDTDRTFAVTACGVFEITPD